MATTSLSSKDACDLLDADHKEVKKLFKEYDSLMSSKAKSATQRKQEVAREICTQLTVHAQIEEEIFYPAFRAAIANADLIEEAEVEHQTAKDLIAQIESMDDPQEKMDAKVTVLGEYIDHHVKEERNEIFPKARASKKMDLISMRETLQARKDELLSEQATA